MKWLLIFCALSSSMAFGIVQPASLWTTYRELYPSDPLQRQALNDCFTEDAQFNRLDPNAREACYRHSVAAFQINGPNPPVKPPNFVDLSRAAGAGSLPQNDVRAEQANERFTHQTATPRLR
ncbi:MAG: hypothetical protein JO001_21065 [Alphaproteobacteria bacterium]|nr:hypothetical protein [Alphaproteobacteria bacterium]